MSLIESDLKERAIEIGLDFVGVCSSSEFSAEKSFLEERKKLGKGPGPFEESDISLRVTPELLLPKVNSIVAAGVSYLMDDEELTPGDRPQGWLSRYCRGLDYHHLLEERLEALASWIRAKFEGSETKVYVDTGPPLDRAIAERAGLGRFGKSTMLIRPGLGTWTFLGQILTTAKLSPDEPMMFNACGSCTRCIDECPTGCIEEWQIDYKNCLGYINQMDGIIPTEFREIMGSRLFGCDDCQDVCPYNQNAVSNLHSEFEPIAEIGSYPDLVSILEMTEAEFIEKYSVSAIEWRGLETLKRNAIVALGNSTQDLSYEYLSKYLSCDTSLLRAHAAWAIGNFARSRPDFASSIKSNLHQQHSVETDDVVKEEIRKALSIF